MGRVVRVVHVANGEMIQVMFVNQGYMETRLPRTLQSLASFRRLVRDYERLPKTLADLHLLAFTVLMHKRFIQHGPTCTNPRLANVDARERIVQPCELLDPIPEGLARAEAERRKLAAVHCV